MAVAALASTTFPLSSPSGCGSRCSYGRTGSTGVRDLSSAGKGLKTSKAVAAAAGTVKLKLKATGKAKKKLKEKGKVKLKAKVTFTPTGGDPATKFRSLKLKKNL